MGTPSVYCHTAQRVMWLMQLCMHFCHRQWFKICQFTLAKCTICCCSTQGTKEHAATVIYACISTIAKGAKEHAATLDNAFISTINNALNYVNLQHQSVQLVVEVPKVPRNMQYCLYFHHRQHFKLCLCMWKYLIICCTFKLAMLVQLKWTVPVFSSSTGVYAMPMYNGKVYSLLLHCQRCWGTCSCIG